MKNFDFIHTKRLFFRKLHGALSARFPLSVTAIKSLRTRYLFMTKGKKAEGWTRNSMCLYYAHRLAHARNLGEKKKQRYEQIVSFLASCSHDDFLEVTAQTEFDRRQKFNLTAL